MSLLTSMFNAVSGMKNHSRNMDIISNNIANVNTIGYKSQRLTFADALSQTLKYASGPANGIGGTNAIQIGLGTQVASVSTLFNQGTIENTGVFSDLAIDGDGFFVVKKNSVNYYTRNGEFVIDAKGNLVSPGTGAILQGYLAVEGAISKSAGTVDLTIPLNDKSKAKQTSTISFLGNLRSSDLKTVSDPSAIDIKNLSFGDTATSSQSSLSGITTSDTVTVGSDTYTYGTDFTTFEQLFALIKKKVPNFTAVFNPSNGTYALSGSLSQSSINSIDIKNLSYSDTATSTPSTLSGLTTTDTVTVGTRTYTYGTDFTTLAQLFEVIKRDVPTFSATYDSTNKTYTLADSGNPPEITSITSTNADLESALNAATALGTTKIFSAASTDLTITSTNSNLESALNATSALGNTKTFFSPSSVTSNVSIYDSQGNRHLLRVTFSRSDNNIWDWTAVTDITSTDGTSTTTTIKQIGSGEVVFNSDGSFKSATSVSSSSQTSISKLDIKSISYSDTATSAATSLSGLTTADTVTAGGFTFTYGTDFTTLEGLFALIKQNVPTFSATYNSTSKTYTLSDSGDPPVVTSITSTNIDLETALNAAAGLDTTKVLSSASTDSSTVSTSPSISFPTTNGTGSPIEIALNFGAANSYLGITQVENPTTLANQQDGFTAGDLSSLSIDQYGKILGSYTNGQFKTLGQIALARFRNNGGLDRMGESLFTQTINSGDPMINTLEEGSSVKIVSGGLESSGVDLTEEFSRMIITQRGYQANARLITTSDEMTQDLIALKR